jgi:hypothetical protein
MSTSAAAATSVSSTAALVSLRVSSTAALISPMFFSAHFYIPSPSCLVQKKEISGRPPVLFADKQSALS